MSPSVSESANFHQNTNLKRHLFCHQILYKRTNFLSQQEKLRDSLLRFITVSLLRYFKSHSNMSDSMEGGDHSGASQPHKHIQFIPIEEEDGGPIERVAKSKTLETPGAFHPVSDWTPP